MQTAIRHTGVDVVGDAPWGTHFCQFYQTKDDMLDVLVPYFKAGLDDNEFCMWVTSEPLSVSEALQALRKVGVDVDRCIAAGQLEVIPHSEWYLKGGYFDLHRVLDGWRIKLELALSRGFDGIRVTGNTAWLEKSDWRDFTDYEAAINDVIGRYQMTAICTYWLDKCSASEVVDVIRNHQFALIKRDGRWETIESAERRRIGEALIASEERYRTLFEQMAEGFAVHEIICDQHGKPCDYRFLEVNPAFEKQTGLKRADVVGRTALEVIPGLESWWIETYGQVALSRDPIRFENFSGALGKWYEVVAFSPSPGQFATLFVDITERKMGEEALRRANTELEAFSYSVSHDLRAPLRAIDGFGQALLEDQADKLDENGKEHLHRIRAATGRMSELIDDLLSLSRLARTEVRKDIVDLSELAREIGEQLLKNEPERKVELVIAPGVTAEGDKRLLRLAMENLLDNAWKFSSKQEQARIEFGTFNGIGERVFYVRDNGVGFDMSYASKLFGAFQRLHQVSEFPGNGIGLAIVQRVAQRHGGRVWAESVPGKVTTFSFTLGS